jgi:hypothetical protein
MALLWAGAVAISGALVLPAHAGDLRVGAGKASVTPGAADFPYAPSDTVSLNTGPGERSFVGVHDDVYARALVMDDGVRRAALVVLEVTEVPKADELVKAVARQIGIRESNVMVAATHTHSVPLFSYAGGEPSLREAREIERLKHGALEAVRLAQEHLQPARVAFARGEAWINVNNGEQSGSKEGYDPRGPSDRTLDAVRFDTPEGAPIAVLLNYASHAEVMFRSVTKGDGYEVSGDLPGAVSRLLETLPGPAPLVLFTSAAEADQLTLFKSLTYTGRLPAADEGAAGWALLDVQARRLSDAALGLLAAMPAGTSQVHLEAATGSASCPGQRLHIDNQTGKVLVEDKPPVAIPLGVIRINDIVLAGVGGDVASEIGQEFKAASPFADAILISMMGHSVGHIMTDALYEHPGHGLTKSPLKPHCAEHAVVDGLIGLLRGAT